MRTKSWVVLTPEEREGISVGKFIREPIGIGYATWLRAVDGKPIPEDAAKLCRFWLRKQADKTRSMKKVSA